MKQFFLTKFLGIAFCLSVVLLLNPGCSNQKMEKTDTSGPIIEVPFDESMGRSESTFKLITTNADDMARYAKAKNLYEKNLPSKVAPTHTPRIPKIIHQIWLGPNLPPAFFGDFQTKIKQLHPDWQYHLWNEAELEELALDNWDIVQKSTNWAEKSDIIRCDLLDRFGGVYLDVDIDMHHSLNELHEKYDFYAGMEHPHQVATTANRIWVGISIMASRPGHPIMKNWKRRIRNCWDDVNLRFSSQIERVINHTFFNFTHSVMQEIDQPGNIDILLPATYFYPIAPQHAAKRLSTFRSIREKFYDVLESLHLRKPRLFTKTCSETIGTHYWGNSWLPGLDQQIRELQRIVDASRKEMFSLQNKVRSMEKRLQSSEAQLATVVNHNRETVSPAKNVAQETPTQVLAAQQVST